MDISKIWSVGKNHHCLFTNRFPSHSATTTNVNPTCAMPSWFPRRPAWLRHPWNHGPERCILGQKREKLRNSKLLVQKMNFNYWQFYFPWKLFWKWVMSEILSQKSWTKGATSWWKIGVENVGNSILWRRKEPNWHRLLTETLWQIRKRIFVGEMLPRGQNALRRSTVLPVTKCRKHWKIRKSWFAVWTWCIFHFALFSYLVIFWWNWPIQQFLSFVLSIVGKRHRSFIFPTSSGLLAL